MRHTCVAAVSLPDLQDQRLHLLSLSGLLPLVLLLFPSAVILTVGGGAFLLGLVDKMEFPDLLHASIDLRGINIHLRVVALGVEPFCRRV